MIFEIIRSHPKSNCNIKGRNNLLHGTNIFLGHKTSTNAGFSDTFFPLEGKMPLSRRSYLQIQRVDLPVSGVQIEQNAATVALEGGVADDL